MLLTRYYIDFVSKILCGGLIIAILQNLLGKQTNMDMVIAMSIFLFIWVFVFIFNKTHRIFPYYNIVVYITTLLPYFSSLYGTGPYNGIIQILFLSLVLVNTKSLIFVLSYGLININIIFFVSQFFNGPDSILTIEYIIVSVIMLMVFKLFSYKDNESGILKQFLDQDICKLKINPDSSLLIDSANIFKTLNINHNDFVFKLFLKSLSNEDKKFILKNMYNPINSNKTIHFNNRYFNCIICYNNDGTIITLIDITAQIEKNIELKHLNTLISQCNSKIYDSIEYQFSMIGSYLELFSNTNDERIKEELIKSMYNSYLSILITLEKYSKSGAIYQNKSRDVYRIVQDISYECDIRLIHDNNNKFDFVIDEKIFKEKVTNLLRYLENAYNIPNMRMELKNSGNLVLEIIAPNIYSDNFIDINSINSGIFVNSVYNDISLFARYYNGSFRAKRKGESIVFRLTLKLIEEEPVKSIDFNQIIKNKRIAIVDDSNIFRAITKAYFKEFDCIIDDMTSAEELINNLQDNVNYYDVIYMDMQMAGLGGFKAVEILRDRNCTSKIICISAFIRKNDYLKVFELGFDEVVKKPFTKKILIDKTINVLGDKYES